MPMFKKRPVWVEAVRYDPDNPSVTIKFIGCNFSYRGNGELKILTREGDMLVSPGDWVIRGVAGEFYPCKPEIFAATYDEVD